METWVTARDTLKTPRDIGKSERHSKHSETWATARETLTTPRDIGNSQTLRTSRDIGNSQIDTKNTKRHGQQPERH